MLSELKLPGEFGPIGRAVGSLADVNGDGVRDLFVSGTVGTFVKSGANGGTLAFASNAGETPLGVDGTEDFVTATGVLTGGIAPTLNGYGNLAAGGQVSIKVRHAEPGTSGAWFIGLSQGNLPFKQGVLVPWPLGFFLTVPIGTNGAGQIILTANNPDNVFAGLSLHHQFWFVDPGATAGLSATNGLREIFK